jgi:hypothetical protein
MRRDSSLLAFPVLTWVFSSVVWVLFSIPVALLRDWDSLAPVLPLAVFLLYFTNYGVILFCNTALLHCVHSRLTGEPCTVREGFARAARQLPHIVAWAIVGGLVGQLASSLEKRGKLGENLD